MDHHWRERAACKPLSSTLFDAPAQTGPNLPSRVAERLTRARAVCADCPVAADCFEDGVRSNGSGVYGGHLLSGGVPREWRATTNPPAPHGTYAAFSRHKNRGETPCEPCRDARREYMARNKRGQRARGRSAGQYRLAATA